MRSVVRSWVGSHRLYAAAFAAFAGLLGIAACGSDGTGTSSNAIRCTAGQALACTCTGGGVGLQSCNPDGSSLAPCMCGTPGAGAGAGAGGAAGVAGGTPGAAGASGAPGATAGTGGAGTNAGASGAGMSGGGGQSGAAGMTMTAGRGGSGGTAAGAGGMTGAGAGAAGSAGTAGSAGMAGSAGSAGSAPPAADMDALRQSCVDTINMYRATLGKPPYKRATPAQEACSDMGAKKDGDSGQAHGSAGDCLGAQNTCPGYPVRGMGVAGIETALKGCLQQMWNEGMPPVPVNECIRDSRGCFQMYGHWINMQSDSSTTVSCGFYMMQNGRYWMNQDFGR